MNDAGSPTAAADSADRDFSIARHEGPYPGLRPYGDNERDLFFGRDEQIADIIERLRTRRFAAILGGSGSGKSSLIRAGVIPELRLYAVPGRSDTWVPIISNPGDAPIRRLAAALDKQLVAADGEDEHRRRLSDIEDILNRPNALEIFLKRYQEEMQIGGQSLAGFGKQASLLIVVDQFEEIFREQALASKEVEKLIDLITEAYDSRNERIYVVLTMRTEALDRCAGYLSLPDILNDVSYLTRRLKPKELEEVIVEPARRYFAGKWPDRDEIFDPDPWPFEPEVRAQLLDAVNAIAAHTDHLPLLQHLLFWLWRAAHDRWSGDPAARFSITLADLETVLGAEKATAAYTPPAPDAMQSAPDAVQASMLGRCLEYHAEQIYTELSTKDQDQCIASQMFVRLAEVDERGVYKRLWTTRQAIADAAGVTIKDVNRVLERYTRPHPYLRTDGDEPEDNIDVSHESFIRNWIRFRNWLAQRKDAKNVLVDIVRQYVQWRDSREHKNWLKRAFIWYWKRLDKRTRARASHYDLDSMLLGWSDRNETQMRGACGEYVTDSECWQAINYYKRSQNLLYADLLLLFLLIGSAFGAAGYGYAYIERGRQASLEAGFYNAYSVAASVAQIPVSPLDSTLDQARRMQTATALSKFDSVEKKANDWEGGEAGLTLEAARRFTLTTLDATTNDVIRSSRWEVDRPDSQFLREGAQPSSDPQCLKSLLATPDANDQLYRGEPVRGGPAPLIAVRRRSGSPPVTSLVLGVVEDGECRRIPPYEIPIDTVRNLAVDPDFRLVVALIDEPPKQGTSAETFFVQRLRWSFFGERDEYRVDADAQSFPERVAETAFRFGPPDKSKTVVCLGSSPPETCYAIAWLDPAIEAPQVKELFTAPSQAIEFPNQDDGRWLVNSEKICADKNSENFCLEENGSSIKTRFHVPIVKMTKNYVIVDFSADQNYLVYSYTGKKQSNSIWANLIIVLKVPQDGLSSLRGCQSEKDCKALAVLQHPIKSVVLNGPLVRRIRLDAKVKAEIKEREERILVETVDLARPKSRTFVYYEIPFGIPAMRDQISGALVKAAGSQPEEKWKTPTYRLLEKLDVFPPTEPSNKSPSPAHPAPH